MATVEGYDESEGMRACDIKIAVHYGISKWWCSLSEKSMYDAGKTEVSLSYSALGSFHQQ